MKYLILFFLFSTNLISSESEKETKKNELLDFNLIKDYIKKDGLDEELKKKELAQRKQLETKKLYEVKKFNIPNEDNFWSFFSELWLIKNATQLKWDFSKPDFELEKSFGSFLESQGFFEKKIKILVLDSSQLIHAGLPSNSNEYILLLSLPFIRTLDLSKLEISLILFEDFLRINKNQSKNFVHSKELENILGTNFNEKKLDKKIIDDSLKKMNRLFYEKGFSFQEQFEVTKEMDKYLKNDLKVWNTYFAMLKKIDNLVKTNELYKKYTLIYPSPELQMEWLKPKTTVL